ncbi:LOW QUALITY PROTEIN: apolipoprotein B-100 [Antennarius striatus]|uniref:LOW QUALITY PROTEIN: apolipoprotein B-100 n=1 Tax=Antennarius striatus TaxID=241820 RepID=UPI0035B0A4DD
MGSSKLCLVLLLTSYTLAQESSNNNQQTPRCLLATRFKTHRKYIYQYTTESTNTDVGTSDLRNGPKVSCQVEIEVPQMCRFIMQTRHCRLSKVLVINTQGLPVFEQTQSSEAFRATMEKNPLKFIVEDITNVLLFPETDEPINVLNIKRGIISAFMVPIMEDEQISLTSTVLGQCETWSMEVVNKYTGADVRLLRDLSQCDQFYSRELPNSPIALMQKLHHLMSKMITSTQECNYQLDNRGKHITTATCKEKHIYLPFSYGDIGISSKVKQDLIFRSSKRTNNRVFDVNHGQSKPLHFEDSDNKAPIQSKDTALSTFQGLMALAGTDQGRKRTSLFYKLVSNLRALRNDTLSKTVTEMLAMSGWLTWQALLQCGTPECTSAILQSVRTFAGVSLEVDTLVYVLSLQDKPNAAHVRDMLSMAQFKQSKAVMYALANTVKKFHKGEVTLVVKDVSDFMETLLNDCSGQILDHDSDAPPDSEDVSFLVLRVVGVMGKALQAASSSLISMILYCAQKTDLPLLNQKAAIQALRLMDINDEIRNVLLKVYKDDQSPVEKRVAAYLVLMKNPDQDLVRNVVDNFNSMGNEELRSFVASHLNNIHKSTEPQLRQFREHIKLVTNEHLSSTKKALGMSKNYKIDSSLGSIQSNIVFDSTVTLPKELMLETTLRALDSNYDIFEVGIEGTGFEPMFDELFGEKGFFPDSISKLTYWVRDKLQMLRGIFDRKPTNRNKVKTQIPQDLLEDIRNHFQRIINHLSVYPAPEVTAYLRLFGNEMGYMKTSDIRKLTWTLFTYYHVFKRILPAKAFLALTSNTDNEVFAHYIFMENVFSLPTVSGLPLKFSLAGVFATGAKGGLTPSRPETSMSFMPSVGLEFITQMGVYIPEHVDTWLAMHTNIHHESSFNAKVTVSAPQIRLSILAPKSNTQLFSVSNTLLSASSGKTEIVPSRVKNQSDSNDCQPLFKGLTLCTIMHYSNVTSFTHAPYYPLPGETRFAVEIQPTGDVAEYTATITAETFKDSKRSHCKVDSVKLTLKAEGDDTTEATASMTFDRNKKILTTDVVIPDYNVEARMKLSLTDSKVKGKMMHGITVDVTNNNIHQFTLVGNTRFHIMKDAVLQLQMAIPSLEMDASLKAALNEDEGVLMNLETFIKLPETLYQQKASLKYDDDKFELELKFDMNSEIQKLIPTLDNHRKQLQQLIDHILDQRVEMTDMKYRHIVSKVIEAGNIWLEKLTARIRYLINLRNKRSISDLTLPVLPEKLFLHFDSLLQYQFNKDKIKISFLLPLGGKTSQELNIPSTLYTPVIDLRHMGIYFPASNYQLPSFTIPPSLDFTVPLLGLLEAFTKINSNLYSWEGSISGGNNTVDVPNYVVQFKARAQSPFNLLSYKLEGMGMMSGGPDDNLKYVLNNSFSHILIETNFNISDIIRIAEKQYECSNFKIEASSPIGLKAFLHYSAQSVSTLNSDEVSGNGTMDGWLQIGSFYTITSYTQNYILHPLDREGRGRSTLHFNTPFVQVHNRITGDYANSELNIESKTYTINDILSHVAELKYKDSLLIFKCNCSATGMGKKFTNKFELGVSSLNMAIFRFESQTDDHIITAYSLTTTLLDSPGLELNSEGSFTFEIGRGLHVASVIVTENGLIMNGTNSFQFSPVTAENIINGAIDSNGATLSSKTKIMADESKGEMNIEGTMSDAKASLQGVLEGNMYDAAIRNTVNIVFNRRGLTLTSNIMGSLRQMHTENRHMFAITLWTLTLRSISNNFFCKDIYYKQDTKADLRPFVMAFVVTNDLKFHDVGLNAEGHVKLQPFKVDLSGGMKGNYRQKHNIKYIYEIEYVNMAGTMRYSTFGNVIGAQLSHNCALEFAGLSSKSDCEIQVNSEPLHFNSTVRTIAMPFILIIDAFVSSDGEMNLDGKHTGQLYSKLLVTAEPQALAVSHDSRVLTTHMFVSGESATNVVNTFDGFLTPTNQFLEWNVKSKLNKHAYNQSIVVYNNPERIGLEFSGVSSTDIFSKFSRNKRLLPEMQHFNVTGELNYDKNSDCDIIEISLIDNFPAPFEEFKNTFVQALESLQSVIHTSNITQIIIYFRAKLEQLPIQVNDFMQKIDFESNINQLKAKLDYLIDVFSVTKDDLEVAMDSLKKILENFAVGIAEKARDFVLTFKNYVSNGQLAHSITNILSEIENHLLAYDEKNEIKQTLIKALETTERFIKQIDLQKFSHITVAWLKKFDTKYLILDKIKDNIFEIQQTIEKFDISMFLQDVKDYLLSFDFAQYAEQLLEKIPSSGISKVIESMNDVIVSWIDEYEIPNKLNTVYIYVRGLLLKYNLDQRFKELMDQVVILIKEFKINKTVQSLVDTIKTIPFEIIHQKFEQFMYSVTNELRTMDFNKSIIYIDKHFSSVPKLLKEFNYSFFIVETNKRIAELTHSMNNQIKMYEIVQKIEVVRQFFRKIQKTVFTYLDKLKSTKVADALEKLKKVADTTFYNDIKMTLKDMLEDMRQRIISMDIREEIYIYLKMASESYGNMVAYISEQFGQLIGNIRKLTKDRDILSNINKAVGGVFATLKRAEIEVPAFVVPLTDLIIPAFTMRLDKLQQIRIPNKISVPEFNILGSYTIPAFTIDFDKIKSKMITIIDHIREFNLEMPNPNVIFGDLKVLYLSKLPDLTFPEITLSEITFPVLNIPKLNLTAFEITLLPTLEIKFPVVTGNICIPVFGKLNGEFRVTSPLYSLVTTGKIENSTSMPKYPQFTATFSSHAKSPIEVLEYTFEAAAQVEKPRMHKMLFREEMKAVHTAFSIDHKGSLTLSGSSAVAFVKTATKAKTEIYKADFINNMELTLKSGMSAVTDTIYHHILENPSFETLSHLSVKHNAIAKMESGTISVTGETTGFGNLSFLDYTDEGTHKSSVVFNINFGTAKLAFIEETDCKALKSKQRLTVESVNFSHFTVDGRCETESFSVKKSALVLNGKGHIGDLKVALLATHDAEFNGNLIGSMTNSIEFMVQPFEIVLDIKNKLKSKIFFPLKLTGKVDLQHDLGLKLNLKTQGINLINLARFNHYKYNHNLAVENNEMGIFFSLSADGEANLDFLTVPLSIPHITVPYLEINTPDIRDFSLWEHTQFEKFLGIPQQSFNMSLRLQYFKNRDVHNFELQLEPFYNAVKDNANIIQAQFEKYRDKVVSLLNDSYFQAKSEYFTQKIHSSSQPPRIFFVPDYKIPLLSIEVSSSRFRVPALGFSVPSYTLLLPSLELHVLHIPEILRDIKLPAFILPAIQNHLVIPAIGNMTCEFSFKSTVITLSFNGSFYNQSDIVARFSTSSTSVFDMLNVKIDGTSSLTKKRGIKLATAVYVEHNNIEAHHDCAVNVIEKGMGASIANNAKIYLPYLNLGINQELTGHTLTKPNAAFKESITYMFYFPLIESVGKGNFDMNWALEAFSSYVFLKTLTQGMSDITFKNSSNFASHLDNEAAFYLSAKGLAGAIRTALNTNIDKHIFQFDMNENLTLEVSPLHIFATVDLKINNNANLGYISTNEKHISKGQLYGVPLTTLMTSLNIDANQPSNLGHTGFSERITISISSVKQSFTWIGKEQLAYLTNAHDLLVSSDESEAHMDFTVSLGGHLALLKSIKLPVYQKTLWEVFKFDQVTNTNDLQFLNISSSIGYRNSMVGNEDTAPFSVFTSNFGALSATLKVSSPIYKVSTTASLEKKDSSLVTSLDSFCTSTMLFLEYVLSVQPLDLIMECSI